VLLLDEADLFLSKRTKDDVERNSYVTIFLRRLEYYQGILFLTSNRVEEFDPAFSSRIHLKVPFRAPDESVRASIWRNFLINVKECRDWDGSVYERLGRDLQVNGREIKNLKKIARVIALHKKQPLTEQILRDVYALNYRSRITGKLGSAQAD
jgi:ATP-dependent 26S proteasome regulatory subunit